MTDTTLKTLVTAEEAGVYDFSDTGEVIRASKASVSGLLVRYFGFSLCEFSISARVVEDPFYDDETFGPLILVEATVYGAPLSRWGEAVEVNAAPEYDVALSPRYDADYYGRDEDGYVDGYRVENDLTGEVAFVRVG